MDRAETKDSWFYDMSIVKLSKETSDNLISIARATNQIPPDHSYPDDIINKLIETYRYHQLNKYKIDKYDHELNRMMGGENLP